VVSPLTVPFMYLLKLLAACWWQTLAGYDGCSKLSPEQDF